MHKYFGKHPGYPWRRRGKLAGPLAESTHDRVPRWFDNLAAPALAAAALSFLLPSAGRSATGSPPSVDLRHIEMTGRGATAPVAGGGRAELTLDPKLQRAAAKLLARAAPRKGAVVLIEARTGRILVWAEHGARRPGDVLLKLEAPSASVFKIVTSVALIERTHASTAQRICYLGGMHRIERRHLQKPHPGPGVRCVSFYRALGHSINAIFAQLATRYLMRDDLVSTGQKFGFNHPLPFDAPVELGTLHVPYNDLAFARTSAGFVNTKLSTLGAAYLAYSVAAGGRMVRTHIVESAGDYHAPRHREIIRRVFRIRTARLLTRMMEVTVQSGTSVGAFTDESHRSYLPGVRVAGKTGTLKPSSHSPTTSWFTGFAPSRKPRVVVGVLLENGHVWREKANEVARDMLRVYFAHHGNYPRVADPLE